MIHFKRQESGIVQANGSYAPELTGASGQLACKHILEIGHIMADTTSEPTKTPSAPAKGGAAKSKAPAKSASLKTGATAKSAEPIGEAKSRFNAALEEAKAGAVALRAEAENRMNSAGDQAKDKGNDLVAEAKNYGEQALSKAGELAVEGKSVASDAIASLGKVVADTAPQIDEKLGEQYGDYARRASRSLTEASAKLETKSIDELSTDAREFVRKSPGTAVGIAAVVGFLIARLFRGSKD
jgi:ElaB/YqjD/DUF883 family membrane-anchored ribosome-binding protein